MRDEDAIFVTFAHWLCDLAYDFGVARLAEVLTAPDVVVELGAEAVELDVCAGVGNATVVVGVRNGVCHVSHDHSLEVRSLGLKDLEYTQPLFFCWDGIVNC